MYFTYYKGFNDLLAMLLLLSVVNAFLLPAYEALMDDSVPRKMRVKVMVAFRRGTIMISPVQSGGGLGIGYAFALPVVFGFLVEGYIYSLNPHAPFASSNNINSWTSHSEHSVCT
jgi:hypothetical protein